MSPRAVIVGLIGCACAVGAAWAKCASSMGAWTLTRTRVECVSNCEGADPETEAGDWSDTGTLEYQLDGLGYVVVFAHRDGVLWGDP